MSSRAAPSQAPRPARRSNRRTEVTRASILEAARGLIEDRAGAPWSMDEVADRAGVTRMTVYRHFGSRTDLLLATVQHADAREDSAGRFSELLTITAGGDALARWVDIWAGYVPRIHRLAQALLAARSSDPAAAAAWDDRMAYHRDGCRHMAQRLEREGLLAAHLDVETAADLMWAITSIQLRDALIDERGWSDERYRSQLRRVLQDVLIGCQGSAARRSEARSHDRLRA